MLCECWVVTLYVVRGQYIEQDKLIFETETPGLRIKNQVSMDIMIQEEKLIEYLFPPQRGRRILLSKLCRIEGQKSVRVMLIIKWQWSFSLFRFDF